MSAASMTSKPRFHIRQADVIRPSIAVALYAQAIAVVLDFVKPIRSVRNPGSRRWNTELKRLTHVREYESSAETCPQTPYLSRVVARRTRPAWIMNSQGQAGAGCLLMYMNKTVRFFGRIVAHPIQHASLFADNESHPKPV